MPFNVGPLELVIVLVIALIILGPKRLPEVGKSIGNGMREFKDAISGNSKDDDDDEVTHLKASERAGPLLASAGVRIARSLLDQIIAQARAEAPDECCGMIASIDGEAVAVHPAVNAAHSPLRYEIDGKDQIRIFDAIDEAGHDLGAIYHSHTRSEAVPSQTDINLAFYPDAIYVIVGVAGAEDDVRAWTIKDGEVDQVELEVT